MQCGMNLSQTADGQWQVSAREFPTNRGGMCRKGWTSAQLLDHPERLTTPLLRTDKSKPFEAVSWDEALDYIAAVWDQIGEHFGRRAVGVFGGGGLTNEKAYLLGKFARVALKTPHIDYNGRYCMASAASAGIRAFGLDRGLPFPMPDIAETDTILLIGSNIAETMPPIVQWFEALRESGGQLFVVDPRATPTTDNCDRFLQITPGTDIVLANGLLYLAIEEGLIDETFIRERTVDFELAKQAALNYYPPLVEQLTGIDEEQLREVVRRMASGNTMVLTARGAEQHANGTDTVQSFINLALALGKVGKPLNGYGTLTGQGNGQGGREHGQKADQLPGYRKIDDPQHRQEVARVWGIEPDELPGPGVNAYDLLNSIGEEDGLRSLFVMGSNLSISSPRAGHIREKLKQLEFLVVSELFLSETALLADVVLPAAQWAEEEGTMTNLEGRVLRRKRAKTPPPGVWSDTKILAHLADRLGCGDKFPSRASEVWDELRRCTAGAPADYSGISYERIEAEDGVFWPCAQGTQGTQRMFLDKFATEDGRARFHAIEWWGLPEAPDQDYPYYFTTGRVMAQYQSGTQTRRVGELNRASGAPFVELNPALARELGIEEGTRVRVWSRRGQAFGVARLSEAMRADTLFMPFHWGADNTANLLTLDALDPVSKMPEFKVCAAQIERA